MSIILVFLFLLVCASLRFKQGGVEQALSISQTKSIKGMCVIFVFLSHFCSYILLDKSIDVPLGAFCRLVGQLMVVPFLFYSGYGIFESSEKKGPDYVKSLPKKRILKILLHFDLAVALFLIYDSFFAPEYLDMARIFLALFAWSSIGNSTWFIFAIICAYIFSYIGLLVFKGDRKKALFFITSACLFYIAIISRFKDGWWFDSILAFPLGAFFSLNKSKINSLHGGGGAA